MHGQWNIYFFSFARGGNNVTEEESLCVAKIPAYGAEYPSIVTGLDTDSHVWVSGSVMSSCPSATTSWPPLRSAQTFTWPLRDRNQGEAVEVWDWSRSSVSYENKACSRRSSLLVYMYLPLQHDRQNITFYNKYLWFSLLWYSLRAALCQKFNSWYVALIYKSWVMQVYALFGTSAKLLKATISCDMSVQPHETTLFPLDQFDIRGFLENMPWEFKFH
jgi:hypothetical protein